MTFMNFKRHKGTRKGFYYTNDANDLTIENGAAHTDYINTKMQVVAHVQWWQICGPDGEPSYDDQAGCFRMFGETRTLAEAKARVLEIHTNAAALGVLHLIQRSVETTNDPHPER